MDGQTLIPYRRVSTDEQGNSLGDQARLQARYAELYGHSLLAAEVDEDVSAGVELEKRPGGARLLARLAAGEADGFLITEIDRAFRLTVDGLVTAAWFTRRGLSIHTVFERVDTSHPDGWMSFAQRLVSAEWERRKIGYRTKRTLDGLRGDGRQYGPVPFGCVAVDGHLFRDPEAWRMRELMVRLAGEGKGAREICRQMRALGIPAPGGVGRGGKATGGRLWHASTVTRILRTHHGLEHIPPLPAAHETEGSDK